MLRAAETAFMVFGVYMFSGVRLLPPDSFSPAPVVEISQIETANPLYFAVQLGVYLIAVALILRRPRALWRAATADLLLTSLLVMTVASMLWSDAPDVVFRRWGALLGTTFFAIYLHLRYTVEEQLRLVAWGLGLGIVASLLLFSPAAVGAGMYAGIFENKNSLGRMMSLATVVFIVLASTPRHRTRAIVFTGLAFMLLIMARSSTGLVVMLAVLSLIPLLRLLSRDMRLTIGIGSLALLVFGTVVLLATSNPEAATGVVGRDVTLTGRTDLWQYVIQMIMKRPWLGYGYETFWLWELPWRSIVDEGAGWTAPNAHNGYLEVALALGGLGLLLYLAGLGRALFRALNRLRADASLIGSWPVIYLCFVLLYNLTEIAVLTRNNLLWVLYVSTLLTVAPTKALSRRRAGLATRRPSPPRPVGATPPATRLASPQLQRGSASDDPRRAGFQR